jgi:hypothetical protein
MTIPRPPAFRPMCILLACVGSGVGCGRAESPPLAGVEGRPRKGGSVAVGLTTAN